MRGKKFFSKADGAFNIEVAETVSFGIQVSRRGHERAGNLFPGAGETAKKIIFLAGQSIMQGQAKVRAFPALALNPATAPLWRAMLNEDGSPVVCEQVWISSLGSSAKEKTGRLTVGCEAEGDKLKIGPEFTFGLYLHQLLDEPILIIKTAWGRKSLHTDFRPPSGGPYEFHPTQLERLLLQQKDNAPLIAENEPAIGRDCRLMIELIQRVKTDIRRVYPDFDPAQGYELAGFVCF